MYGEPPGSIPRTDHSPEFPDAMLRTGFKEELAYLKNKKDLIDPYHHFGGLDDRVDLRSLMQL